MEAKEIEAKWLIPGDKLVTAYGVAEVLSYDKEGDFMTVHLLLAGKKKRARFERTDKVSVQLQTV